MPAVAAWARRQVARRPLLWVAGLCVCAVWWADSHAWLAVLLGGLTVLALRHRRGLLIAATLAALLAGLLHHRALERRLAARSLAGSSAEIFLHISTSPDVTDDGRWVAEATTSDRALRLRLKGRSSAPQRGERIRARGYFQAIEGPRNPASFDRRAWLWRKGIPLEFIVSSSTRIAPPLAWHHWGDGIKRGFREAVTRGLSESAPEAVVIRAVTLGEKPPDEGITEAFRLTGTLHLFAVSGLHVGMVGLLVWCALRLAGVTRRQAVVPLLLVVFGYAWLTGLNPPAVRAAWMAALVLFAFVLRRRPDLGNLLGFALLVVVFRNSDLIFAAGVQLSFGVVFAIGILQPLCSRWYAWMTRTEDFLPASLRSPVQSWWLDVRSRIADLFTVSTSAWLGSTPLTIWHFGLLVPIGIPLSVLLSAIVFPLLGIALLSGCGGWIPAWSGSLNQANQHLARLMLDIADWGSHIPAGNFRIPRDRPAPSALIVYDLGGHGAACWYEPGKALLIDGGSARDFDFIVGPSLLRMGLTPALMAATHADGNHVGGLTAAVPSLPVRQALAPVRRALSPAYQGWLRACEENDVHLVLGSPGLRYPAGDKAWLEVLHRPDETDWRRLADDRVMVLRLHWAGWKILFLSDAGWLTERRMIESGRDLAADVIVAGRHEHDSTLNDEFLEATGARAIIATHDDFPLAEKIPERWRATVEEAGLAVFHQGESGAVIISQGSDGSLILHGYVDQKEFVLKP